MKDTLNRYLAKTQTRIVCSRAVSIDVDETPPEGE